MHSKTEEITPELAAKYLELNTENRPLSQISLRRYVEEMKGGRWQEYTGEAIKFDWNGRLRDGQTRLTAIVESGCTVKLYVTRDIDPKAFQVLDSGKPRSAAETLALSGYKDYTVLSGLARAIMVYENTNRTSGVGASTAELGLSFITNQTILSYVQKNDLSKFVLEGRTFSRNWSTLTPVSWAFYSWLFSQKDEQAAKRFLDMLSTGVGIMHKNDPCGYVRKWVIDAQTRSGTKPTSAFMYALLVTAWNTFRKGHKMRGFDYSEITGRIDPI